jgi:hypothetical protein
MRETKLFNSETILSSSKYGNSFMYEQEQQIQKRRIKKLQWFFVLLCGQRQEGPNNELESRRENYS